jgi:hypothetical protein
MVAIVPTMAATAQSTQVQVAVVMDEFLQMAVQVLEVLASLF